MDNYITFDLLLARQGGVLLHNQHSYCSWINITDQVEKSVTKLKEKATWLSKVDLCGQWDLLLWMGNRNTGSWL